MVVEHEGGKTGIGRRALRWRRRALFFPTGFFCPGLNSHLVESESNQNRLLNSDQFSNAPLFMTTLPLTKLMVTSLLPLL
jgi:hypothetical protein